jgi:hypothetical protein
VQWKHALKECHRFSWIIPPKLSSLPTFSIRPFAGSLFDEVGFDGLAALTKPFIRGQHEAQPTLSGIISDSRIRAFVCDLVVFEEEHIKRNSSDDGARAVNA